jgi:hypothetical protein
MGRYLHVSFSLRQQGDAIGVPLAAWLASSFQNEGIEGEEIHAGLSRSQLGRYG